MLALADSFVKYSLVLYTIADVEEQYGFLLKKLIKLIIKRLPPSTKQILKPPSQTLAHLKYGDYVLLGGNYLLPT